MTKLFLKTYVKVINVIVITDVVVKEQKILVVDDSNIVSNFIKKIFNNTFDVVIANDGKEALDIVNSNTDGKIVGMLLDLNMPNVDGFEVLDYFKAHDLFKQVPVSIITGDSSKEVIDRAFTYPIIDMLQKPFNEVNIKNIVEKTIRRY